MPKMKPYGQSRMDRKNESRGMKDYYSGYEKAEKSNERYMGKMKNGKGFGKVLKSDSATTYGIDTNSQQEDMSRVQWKPYDYRGTPSQAYNYKW